MRGNLHRARRRVRRCGSIPAHAGEPPTTYALTMFVTVYPRACGETQHAHELARSHQVYPRACGGTDCKMTVLKRALGLSPRMRGNHIQVTCRKCLLGSIPAHAGEPAACAPTTLASTVYPRACGGTARKLKRNPKDWGLSPRMRGNQIIARVAREVRGSIPAHAGEPTRSLRTCWLCGVYPRACGGTSAALSIFGTLAGLSPRMRGNRQSGVGCITGLGSIPAHAGEPGGYAALDHGRGVYPRACGGTRDGLA